MVQVELETLGARRYAIPDQVDISQCMIFYNGEYVSPYYYKVVGSALELAGPSIWVSTDRVFLVEIKPAEISKKKVKDA